MRMCKLTVADSCEVENAKNISKLRQFVTPEPRSFSVVVDGQAACFLQGKEDLMNCSYPALETFWPRRIRRGRGRNWECRWT